MNKPGEHYAMFLLYPDGWRQFGIMGYLGASLSVGAGKGKVRAVDMVTNEVTTFGYLFDDMDGAS